MSTPRTFFSSFSLNNLGSIWYCVLTSLVQIYLITLSIYRFTAYVALPWPTGSPAAIQIYMSSIGIAIILLPFFIVVGLMKIGNYSNDGRKVGAFNLGRYSKHIIDEESGDSTEDDQPQTNWWKAAWRHSLPTAPFLHLIISFCFLFPRILVEAQLIRHGFLSKAALWKTDLDPIFARFNGFSTTFFGLLRVVSSNEHEKLFDSEQQIGHFIIRNSKSLSETFSELDDGGRFSLEFGNLIFALVMLTIRYPAVFWRVHKGFSVLFTVHLLLNSLQTIVSVAAFNVLFKVFVCDPNHMLIRFRDSASTSLNVHHLCALFVAYMITVHFSPLALYCHGIQKYREFRYARTMLLQAKYHTRGIRNHLSYLMAMGVFFGLCLSVGPIFYEAVLVYCGTLSVYELMFIGLTMVHFASWAMIWFSLATKSSWTFEFDDFESDKSLLDKAGAHSDSPLIVISAGKLFKVREAAAKQAIMNFVRNNIHSNLPVPCSMQQTVNKPVRSKSFAHNGNIQSTVLPRKHFARASTRSVVPKTQVYEARAESDCESEYAVFERAPQQQPQIIPRVQPIPQQAPLQQTEEDIYGFQFMFNSMHQTDADVISPAVTNVSKFTFDRHSQASSGIGSNGSSSQSSLEESTNLKSSASMESLMQRLEMAATAAAKPALKSVSALQPDNETIVKRQHVALRDFVEHPDYSKYYIPEL